MTSFGCTLMTAQGRPGELVRYAVAAEEVGFDLEVSEVLATLGLRRSRAALVGYVECGTRIAMPHSQPGP